MKNLIGVMKTTSQRGGAFLKCFDCCAFFALGIKGIRKRAVSSAALVPSSVLVAKEFFQLLPPLLSTHSISKFTISVQEWSLPKLPLSLLLLHSAPRLPTPHLLRESLCLISQKRKTNLIHTTSVTAVPWLGAQPPRSLPLPFVILTTTRAFTLEISTTSWRPVIMNRWT
jgi:hypothetical protein